MSDRYEWVNGKVYDGDILDHTYVRDKKAGTVERFEDFINNPLERMKVYPACLIYNDYEFWKFVCTTSPSACRYAPKKFQTPDLIQVIANNTSYNHNLQSMNMAFLAKAKGREAALDIYKTMVKRFADALRDVPKDYWTDELVDIAINEHLAAFSILRREEKTDKRCITAVSKWGRTLRAVPNEKKKLLVQTADGEKRLYEIAVEVDGTSLKFVPKEERTFNLCLQACIQNIDAIDCVPPTVLTPYFINALTERSISVPPKHVSYVGECLKAYGKIDGLLSLNRDTGIISHIPDNSSYRDVALDKLSLIISKPLLKKIAAKGITNLEELFTAYEREDFPTMFTSKTYAEISGVVNVLNCKFKDQDPMLDFSEGSPDYMISKLGFSRKVANQMEHKGVHVGELIEQTRLPLEKQVWGEYLRCVGSGGISESLAKLFIFADYYDRHGKCFEPKEDPIETEIAQLRQELDDLREQREVLNNKIDATIARVVELTRQKNMNGGIAYVKK